MIGSPFEENNNDDGLSSVFTPLLDALFLILVAFLAGYVVYFYEVKYQVPNPIDFPAEEYFGFGETTLDSLGRAKLKSNLSTQLSQKVDSLKLDNGKLLGMLNSINIEGYADAVPPGRNSDYETNEEYSFYRAYSVYQVINELNSEKGWALPDSLFLIGGFGDRKLKIQTEVAEQKNRRIVIRFIFEDGKN
jgi:outer membrane protein OmpA-like peptidoglycan-associated protein